jgi:hypothetical protein
MSLQRIITHTWEVTSWAKQHLTCGRTGSASTGTGTAGQAGIEPSGRIQRPVHAARLASRTEGGVSHL